MSETTLSGTEAPSNPHQYLTSPSSVMRSEWRIWFAGAIFSYFFAGLLMAGWPIRLLPSLSHPFVYAGDGLSHLWIIERAIEGWIFNNPRSGYPFGSCFLDYPGSDSGSLLILKIIGILAGSPWGAANLYFLLGFPVSFIASYAVSRSIGLSRSNAFASALLFAFAPYHFSRLFYGHIFYTWYFVVPVYFYFGYKIFYSGQIRAPLSLGHSRFLKISTGSSTALILLVASCFGVYFAFFGAIVLITCGVLSSLTSRSLRPILLGLLLSGAIAAGVAANLAPSVAYRISHGANAEVANRSPIETEVYALKIAHLLLPEPDHRVPALGAFARHYDTNFPLSNTTSSLGFIGVAGFMVAIFSLLTSSTGRRIDPRVGIAASIAISLLLISTVGGFNVMFALLVTPLIRGWDRISIFIFFAVMTTLFLAVQANPTWGRLVDRRRYAGPALASLLAVFGLLDQTPKSYKPVVAAARSSFEIDHRFITQIERSLPPASAVYQLPYMAFPESAPRFKLSGYSLLAGFINSKTIRWSYGGMQGRPGDLFYRALSKQPVEKQLSVVRKMGFSGIYIDRRGYADHADAVIGKLGLLLGSPPALVRSDGNVVFFRIPDVTR